MSLKFYHTPQTRSTPRNKLQYVLWKVCIQMFKLVHKRFLFWETLAYYVFFLIVFYSMTSYVTKMTKNHCGMCYKNTYFYCSHLFKFITIDLQKNRKLWKHVIICVSNTPSKGHGCSHTNNNHNKCNYFLFFHV